VTLHVGIFHPLVACVTAVENDLLRLYHIHNRLYHLRELVLFVLWQVCDGGVHVL